MPASAKRRAKGSSPYSRVAPRPWPRITSGGRSASGRNSQARQRSPDERKETSCRVAVAEVRGRQPKELSTKNQLSVIRCHLVDRTRSRKGSRIDHTDPEP